MQTLSVQSSKDSMCAVGQVIHNTNTHLCCASSRSETAWSFYLYIILCLLQTSLIQFCYDFGHGFILMFGVRILALMLHVVFSMLKHIASHGIRHHLFSVLHFVPTLLVCYPTHFYLFPSANYFIYYLFYYL